MGNTDNKRINHFKYLLYLVSCAVNDVCADKYYDNIDFKYLLEISDETTLASVIYNTLLTCKNNQEIDKEVLNEFKDIFNQNVFREINQKYELDKMINFCEKNKIKNIPLKGSVLKHDYPYTYLRVMGDVDLWVEEKGIKIIDEYLIKDGYELIIAKSQNIEYIKKPTMIFEVHMLLSELVDREIFNYLNYEAVENVIKDDNYDYSYKLNDVDFYLQILEHSLKHYEYSGISIKMVLDFYILKKKYYDKMSKNQKVQLNNLIEKFGFTELNEKIVNLALDWFSLDGVGLIDDEFSNYIIGNRTYGTSENLVLNENKGDCSTVKHTLRLLFPSPIKLKKLYYNLLKKPYLLPFYYIVWWLEKINIYFIKRDKKVTQKVKFIDNANKKIKENNNK